MFKLSYILVALCNHEFNFFPHIAKLKANNSTLFNFNRQRIFHFARIIA